MADDKASLLLDYYQTNGATSDDIQDAEREFLIAQGATPATNQDMWYEFLRSRGYTGALPDMIKDFWCIGGGALVDTIWTTPLTDKWTDPMTTDDFWTTPMNTEEP